MSTLFRFSAPIFVAFALVCSGAQAKTQQEKDRELAASKVCTKECTERYGSGAKAGEAYDSEGKETCMLQCMKSQREKWKRAP